ncbi:DUF4326 domain-containing protein [Geminicoccus flavidas]|uniref:DUF4326 domain-containing protein n=1 Tax=Geminicoccus flavidas TaxID=2506407 RepID=UPI001358D9DD|nr:DUF4326 domain-containing protein [Geminicoccus flavidas]
MPVLNKHYHGGLVSEGAADIMRGTPFGNPFVLGRDGDRAGVVALALYRRHLWRKIRHQSGFADQVRALHGCNLCCCCAPLACPGDVLERAAAWLQERSPD